LKLLNAAWAKKSWEVLRKKEKPPPDGHGLLNKSESQRYLGLGRSAFERHVRPSLPRFKIGAKVYYKKRDLDEFIDRIARDTRSTRRRI
jgi:hypothetical protein